MNKNNLVTITIPVILAIAVIIMSQRYIANGKVIRQQQLSLQTEKERSNILQAKRGQYRFYESMAIGQSIDSSIILEELTGLRFTLKDINKNQPTLFFFIDQTHCSSCWGKALEIMVKNFQPILSERTIVLTSYQNFRDIVIPLKELKIDSNVYNIVQGELSPNIQKIGLPFMISVDPKQVIDGMLIVDSDLIEQVDFFVKAFIEKNQINMNGILKDLTSNRQQIE